MGLISGGRKSFTSQMGPGQVRRIKNNNDGKRGSVGLATRKKNYRITFFANKPTMTHDFITSTQPPPPPSSSLSQQHLQTPPTPPTTTSQLQRKQHPQHHQQQHPQRRQAEFRNKHGTKRDPHGQAAVAGSWANKVVTAHTHSDPLNGLKNSRTQHD